MKRFWDKVQKTEGCWLWTASKCRDGYGYFAFDGRLQKAHRVCYQLTRGRPIPAGAWVLHACDNPSCVRPSHLWLGNNRLNSLDRERKGRGRPPYGERNGLTSLTNKDADEIRRRVAAGEKQCVLVKEYGTSPRGVSNIVNNITFAHHAVP